MSAALRRAAVLALALSVTALSACKDQPAPDAPSAPPTPTATSPDTSVPAADSVFNPAGGAPKTDAAAGRTNSTMSRSQESTAMPLPGQNNDHSAPLAASAPLGKGASAP